MSACVGIGLEMRDFMGRLHILLMSAIKLVEDVQSSDQDIASGQGSRSSSALPECNLLLRWDLMQPFTNAGNMSKNSSSPLCMCLAAAEAMTSTLAAGWQAGQQQVIRSMCVPFGNTIAISGASTTCGERQVAALVLGRLFVLVNGDSELGRLLLPLMMDGMLGSDRTQTEPQ
eukprot:evm.model.scf_2686.2 EVM.evm.TU.scf_2686.2   scf_2686:13725-15123(+)